MEVAQKVSLLWKRSLARQKPKRQGSKREDQPNRPKKHQWKGCYFVLHIHIYGWIFSNTFDSHMLTFQINTQAKHNLKPFK